MIPLMNVNRQAEFLGKKLENRLMSVVRSGKYILGEEVSSFEKSFAEYCGCEYAVGVGNGTDALVIALRALGIGHGDEVITTAMSFFATAEAIARVGAKPVFVDCTRDTFTIDSTQIERKINERTKAIIAVHLYGQCADMAAINQIAKQYNLYVVEDCAQAAGAKLGDVKACNLGDISCISFFPTKNLGCVGDGGMILTNSEGLYKICRAFRVHGSGTDGKFAYEQLNDVLDDSNMIPTKYNNYLVGYNSRLDEIQAAILNVKLPFLDDWNKKRNKIANRYNKEIVNPLIQKPKVSESRYHVYYVYVVLVEHREDFRSYLEKNEIGSGVYFPVPLHLQEAFEELGYQKGAFPNAEYAAEHSVAIPMFPELWDDEVAHIIDCINKYRGH